MKFIPYFNSGYRGQYTSVKKNKINIKTIKIFDYTIITNTENKYCKMIIRFSQWLCFFSFFLNSKSRIFKLSQRDDIIDKIIYVYRTTSCYKDIQPFPNYVKCQ